MASELGVVLGNEREPHVDARLIGLRPVRCVRCDATLDVSEGRVRWVRGNAGSSP